MAYRDVFNKTDIASLVREWYLCDVRVSKIYFKTI